MNIDLAKIAISEENNYIRHMLTSAVGWFSFFVTVNYASMGWLAGAADKFKGNYPAIVLISALFVTQNILGIMACLAVRRYFSGAHERLEGLHRAFVGGSDSAGDSALSASKLGSYFPVSLYRRLMLFMVVAMIPVMIAWSVFPLVYPKPVTTPKLVSPSTSG